MKNKMIISEISQKLKIPRHYIDYWKKINLIVNEKEVPYEDLIKIKFIHQCRRGGASLQSIRSYINNVSSKDNRWYKNLHQNLSGTMLYSTNKDPFPVDPTTNQFYFTYKSNEFKDDSSHYNHTRLLRIESNSKLEQSKFTDDGSFVADPEYFRNLKKGKLEKCVSIINDFLVKHPENFAALIELGNLYYESKKYKDAKVCYEKVLKNQPECVEALYNLANIYLREKKSAVSIRYYRKCILIDPEFPETYYNLGLLLLSLNYKIQAIECMEQYIHLDPDSHWGQQASQLLEDLQQKEIVDSKVSQKDELLPFPGQS